MDHKNTAQAEHGAVLENPMKSTQFILISFVLAQLFLTGNSMFAQSLTFTTNTYPRFVGTHAVAVADVNVDGKLDLICVNSDSTVSLLTNDGGGNFVSESDVSVPYVTYVVAADLNGDGKSDFVAYDQNTAAVTTWTNDGTGNFTFNSTVSLSNAYPLFMIAGDVNGDGRKDVVVSTSPGNSMIVLTNDGKGSLVYTVSLPAGNFPQSVAIADFNGDGRQDLAALGANDGAVRIYTNSSSGVFGSNAIYFIAYGVATVASGDLNGDGKPDLVLPNYSSAGLIVWTNNGSGVFASNRTYTVGVGPGMAEIADLNGDGYPDVITANDNFCPGSATPCDNGTLTILTNNGSGILVSSRTITAGVWPLQVAGADFNGDGKKDLIAVNAGGPYYGPNTLTELLNTSSLSAPKIKFGRAGNGLVIAWPSSAGAFILQTNTGLNGTNWGSYGGLISDNGITKTVTNPASSGNQFFRLKQ